MAKTAAICEECKDEKPISARSLVLPDDLWQQIDEMGVTDADLVELVRMLLDGQLRRVA